MSKTLNGTVSTPRITRIAVAIAVVLAIGLAGWANRDRIAVLLAPTKTATNTRSNVALKADELFWHTLHSGAYDDIPRVLEVLTAAYLEAPTDAVTAAHIAWLHNWRVAERDRLSTVPATITDHTILARRYFDEAVKLNPSDARTLGFLAGNILAEGTLHKDERLVRRGYYMVLDAIEAWPEFNLFTVGYVMSRLPPDSPRFKEGLEAQWRELDVCAQERIDRTNPDYSTYMALETKEGPKRACWTWATCWSSRVTGRRARRFMPMQSSHVSTRPGSSPPCLKRASQRLQAMSRRSTEYRAHPFDRSCSTPRLPAPCVISSSRPRVVSRAKGRECQSTRTS